MRTIIPATAISTISRIGIFRSPPVFVDAFVGELEAVMPLTSRGIPNRRIVKIPLRYGRSVRSRGQSLWSEVMEFLYTVTISSDDYEIMV
jgi:hypothetical protein